MELSPLRFFLAVIRPVTCFTGRVNGTPTDPFISIDFNDGATGTASSIGTSGAPVEGNTVFFGSTSGGRDRGLVRLRSWTPSNGSGTVGTLITAENDDVSPNIADDDFITVKLFWQLWDRVPRQDASDPSNILFFEDYDIVYNNQTVDWKPMAVAGPPGVEFLEAGQAQISFIGDRSFALAPGATLSSHLWTAHGSVEGTSSSQGTEGSPVVFTWNAAGQYLVTLKVTDSNGIDHTNYTWAIVIDPADPTAVAYTKFDAISDNFDASQGGGSCNFTVHGVADVSQFPTETLVLHIARGTQTTPTATWPNRANILYAGYITGNAIRQDPVNNTTSFRTVSIDGLMKKLSIYPVRLEDSSNPQNWTQATDLTVDRVLSYLAHWRSTLSLMTSIIPLEYTAELKSQDFNAANLFGMFKSLMGDAWGFPVSDHQSVLYLVRDFNLQTTTERSAATTRKTLHKGIWVAAIDIAERGEYEQPTRKVKWSGVFYPGDQAAAIPLFSEAPGDVMDSWGNEQSRSGLILTTQADLNTRTGFAYSRSNQRYPGVSMRFLNDGSFTVVPQEIFPANIEAVDNNRGLVWTPDLIPRSIRRSYDHQGGFIDYQVTFEPSVTGPGGVTVVVAESADMPAEPPSSSRGGVSPPGDPPPAPPAWSQATVPIPGPAVGADTTDGVYITFDSGASWEERNNLLINPDQLAFQYLIWDPWWFTPSRQGTNDPEQVILWGCGTGFVVKSEDAGKTWQDLTTFFGTPPNDAGDSPAPTISDVTFEQVHATIHALDNFVISASWDSGQGGSGGGAIDPSTIANRELHLDAQDLSTLFQDSGKTTPVTSDADPVGAWADKSGNGKDVTQATAGKRGTYKTGVIGSQPGIRFVAGSLQLLTGANVLNADTTFTIFIVLVPRATSLGLPFQQGVADVSWEKNADLADTFWLGNTDSATGPANVVQNQTAFATLKADGAQLTNYHSGVAGTPTAETSNTGVTGTEIGGRDSAPAVYSDTDIGEIIVYSDALSDANRAGIEQYLFNRWGANSYRGWLTSTSDNGVSATWAQLTINSGNLRLLGLDIDDENGTRVYVTSWTNELKFNLARVTRSTLVIANELDISDAVSESDIDARNVWAHPHTPGFFGTANFGDIVYVHGRWLAGGSAEHIIKSTDGGASFSDIGDSVTWGTGWVGGFMAVDTNTLFAFVNNGANSALYRTIDGGANWTSLSLLPFEVDPGGVSGHPDGRILISNRDAGAAMVAYAESPNYDIWFDATGAPSFPTAGGGSQSVIWIT